MKHLTSTCALALCILFTMAATSPADSVFGLFSDPDLIGTLYNPFPVIQNNVSTANYAIYNNTPPPDPVTGQEPFGSTFEYGVAYARNTYYPLNGGSVEFFGRTAPALPGQTFDLGTLDILNNNGLPNTEIFGATLTLFVSPDGSTDLGQPHGSTHLTIFTGADYDASLNQIPSADYFTVSGVPNQFLYLPNQTGGNIELFGRISGQTVEVTGFGLSYASDPGVYVGEGSPVPAPESSSLLAGGAVLGLIAFEGCRRKRRGAGLPAAAC